MDLDYSIKQVDISSIYLGYSNDSHVRYCASSGGIGTAISKYLLSTKDYGTVLTFIFDKSLLQYVPVLVYSAAEINNCGSIYQDINIPLFIKNNLHSIKNGIILSCPPCQVSVVRNILNKANIKSFIISFSCSGQTVLDGTWAYYNLLGINKNDVENIRYRGNGWPSGISIQLRDGTKIYRENWTTPWSELQSSRLFRPNRCIYCTFPNSIVSDVSLADPWLKEFMEEDKIGHTMIHINTLKAKEIIDLMIRGNYISISRAGLENYLQAQKPNEEKGERLRRYKKAYRIIIKLKNNTLYRKIVTSNLILLRIHIRIINLIYKIFQEND